MGMMTFQVFFQISVHCQWGKWGHFTSCSKTCGEGRKSRNRAVYQEAMHGGDECLGNSTDIQTCKERKCPGTLTFDCKMTPRMLENKSSRSKFCDMYICMVNS